MTDLLRHTSKYSLSQFSDGRCLSADEYANRTDILTRLAVFCKRRYPTADAFSVWCTAGLTDIWITIIPGQAINAIKSSPDAGYVPIADGGLEVYADDAFGMSDSDETAQKLEHSIINAFREKGMICASF